MTETYNYLINEGTDEKLIDEILKAEDEDKLTYISKLVNYTIGVNDYSKYTSGLQAIKNLEIIYDLELEEEKRQLKEGMS